MHDGISKFGSELNGTFIRCLNKDNHPVPVPYSLKKVKGGLNAFELSNKLINEMRCQIRTQQHLLQFPQNWLI